MKINFWFFGMMLMAVPVCAVANGGGYSRGGLEHVGDVVGFEPEQTEKIRILDEKLTIELGPKEAQVEVRYLMRNETNQKVKVRFGFPVEESFDEMIDEERSPNEEANSKPKNKLKYCQDYVITASGKPINSKWQGEEKSTDDPRFKGIVGWLISEITFAAGEEKPVMIRFRSGYPYENWSVSDNESESAALFRYRLSSAACWAGTIGTGKMILKPAGIDPKELRVIKPVNRFKKEGENWVWNFENLEPTLADDLEIEARPRVESASDSDGKRYIERGDQWLMAHTNYRVKASSVLAPADGQTYEAAHVKNFWGQNTWSEGVAGTGMGEWLELKPEVAKPLAAIEIHPGYTKNEELFQANARPKKILIQLNDEHSFIADVPDENAMFRIPIAGYAKPVKTLRLTFQEVWPGKRFEDLCVSGVTLHVKLDQKPKIGPVR